MQQSHSSSPQSQPKQGFETVLIGFLIELPELLEGSVQLIGFETEVSIVESMGDVPVMDVGIYLGHGVSSDDTN